MTQENKIITNAELDKLREDIRLNMTHDFRDMIRVKCLEDWKSSNNAIIEEINRIINSSFSWGKCVKLMELKQKILGQDGGSNGKE